MDRIEFIVIINLSAILLLSAVLVVLLRVFLRGQSERLLRDLHREQTRMAAEATDREYERFDSLKSALQETMRINRIDVDKRLESVSEQSERRLAQLGDSMDQKMDSLSTRMEERLHSVQKSNFDSSMRLTDTFEKINETFERNMSMLREGNERKLEEMRILVDKELQQTLTARLGESFGNVAASLENVQKGLGEMQNLAKDARDLKNVLTNVKTRGGFGEVLLGTLLEDILAPSQFVENVEISPGKRVEFAVKLPGNQDAPVLLPIDSKFPAESYRRLMEAENKEQIESARRELYRAVHEFARQIEEYILPPRTTNFALMFLPTEGLYAEVVKNDQLFEVLRRKHRIIVVGATTLSALLSSLLVGFKTLAIEKRSEEVWSVLAGVKREFEKFGSSLERAKHQLSTAEKTLDMIYTTRMNRMMRALNRVEDYSGSEAEPEEGGFASLNGTEDDDSESVNSEASGL